jgi:hypothetical protein
MASTYGASRSHSLGTLHSVRLLWMTDQHPTRTHVPVNAQHSHETSIRALAGFEPRIPAFGRRFTDVAEVRRECWQPLTALLLKILENVSSSGSSAGIAASSLMGSTLKGTKFQTCRNILNNFFKNPGNFLVPSRTGTNLES